MAKVTKKKKTAKKKSKPGASRKRLTPGKEKRGPSGTDVLLGIDVEDYMNIEIIEIQRVIEAVV